MRRYFDALFGNRDTCLSLGQSIERHALSHALLIEGDAGSGKRTLSREIAMASLCEKRENADTPLPCRACRACHLVENGLAPDVHIISRGERTTLGVDAVRDMIEDTGMSSVEFDTKLYIFEDADAMTAQAQNALLKVMEEPPENVKILLLSTDANAMLSTVRSRARLVRMQRFSLAQITQYLQKNHPSLLAPFAERPKEKNTLLMTAEGSIGRAITLLSPQSQGAIMKEREQVTALLQALTQKSYLSLFDAISALPQKREELISSLTLFHKALRDLILLKRAKEPPLSFFSSTDAIPESLLAFRIGALFAFADVTEEACDDLSQNANISTTKTALACRLRNAQKER